MWIDVGVVLVIAFYTILGFFQGVISQIFRLIGLVLVFFYVWFVTEPVGEWLAVHLNFEAVTAYCVSLIGGALIIYAACALIGRAIHKKATAGEKPQTLNRVLGGALGLIKGAVVAFLLASMLDMAAQVSAGRWPGLQNQAAGSQVMKRVHPLNPLPRLRFLADIPDYKKLLEDPEAQRIFEDPRNKPFARLCNHPKFRLAAGDPQLRLLIEQKNWREVMVNEKVLALVFDREVRGILNELGPWARAALKEAERLRSRGAAG